MSTYSTVNDIIAEVRMTLCGYADEFDCKAIASELYEWEDGHIVADLERDDYWDIVRKHEYPYLVCIGYEGTDGYDAVETHGFNDRDEATALFDVLDVTAFMEWGDEAEVRMFEKTNVRA